jgi:hypothetical protein
MYVCVIHVSLKSCVGSELAMGRSPLQGVQQSVYKIYNFQSMKGIRRPTPPMEEDEIYS